MRTYLSIFIASLLLTSCFHKNVMKDPADDVVQSFIYAGKEGTYIITKEEIFQAVSKSSGGGMTRISGYSEYRLTSYDINTGAQLARVDMGDGVDEAFYILGCADGKMWLFSIDPELGFHCRDPKTLKVLQTEAELSASGPLKGFSFARPEWMRINQQYGFHYPSGKLMLSDMQDYHYVYDPKQKTLTQTDEDISDPGFGHRLLNSNAYFDEDDYVSISGSGRNKLTRPNAETEEALSFLDGEIIMDMNFARLEQLQQSRIAQINSMIAAYQDSMKLLETNYPGITGPDMWRKHSGTAEYTAYRTHGQHKNTTEDLQRQVDRIKNKVGFGHDNVALSTKANHVLIVHGTTVTDTSRLQISYVHCGDDAFKEVWKSTPATLYRDPSAADDMGAFETVMSEGDPSYTYAWADYSGNNLILIWQLQMVCIDMRNGEIRWQIGF